MTGRWRRREREQGLRRGIKGDMAIREEYEGVGGDPRCVPPDEPPAGDPRVSPRAVSAALVATDGKG